MIRATWQLSASIAVALAVVYLVCRASRRPRLAAVQAFCFEFAIVAGVFALYQHTAHYAHTRTAGAVDNAYGVWHLEQHLHLPSEVSVQKLFAPVPELVRGMNAYYAAVHLTSMTVFLVWMWWRHRDHYPFVRNTVAISTVVCVLVQSIPVAPPRMLTELGFVDTANEYGLSMYGPAGSGLANQVAAMPSIHVAWAFMIAWFAMRISTSRWRWLLVAHFVATVVVVVATANHWWLDGAVAIGIVVLTMVGQRLVADAWARFTAREQLAVGEPEPEPVPAA